VKLSCLKPVTRYTSSAGLNLAGGEDEASQLYRLAVLFTIPLEFVVDPDIVLLGLNPLVYG
jgi:hypothetical protein